MDELYLIAHKVRSEPAFDIAEMVQCPCTMGEGCMDCDSEGIYWIIPTSGHRAYPYWSCKIDNMLVYHNNQLINIHHIPSMPPAFPDHYPCNPTRTDPTSGKSLLAKLGLVKKVERRL